MAQQKFIGSAKPTGFKPIEITDREIANMRAESNRMSAAMREARNAEINERTRQLEAIKTNQKLQGSQMETNFQIMTDNATRTREQLKADADTRRRQLEADQAATRKMFSDITALSSTAIKKVQELDEAKFEEDRLIAYEQAIANPNDFQHLLQVQGEAELQATDAERTNQINEGVATGQIDSLTASQLKSMSSGTRLGLEQAAGVYKLTTNYREQLNKAINENPGMTSAETAGFLRDFRRKYLTDPANAVNGRLLIDIKPALLRKGNEATEELHLSIQAAARRREEKDLAEMRYANADAIISQNPAQFNDNILKSFQTIRDDFGPSKAFEWFESLATQRDKNGNFRFTAEQLAQAIIKPGGKIFSEEYSGRFDRMMQARLQSDRQYQQAELAAQDLAYKEAVRNAERIFANDQSQATQDALKQQFLDTFGKVPQFLNQDNTIEARSKARQLEALQNIPPGMVRQVDVDAAAVLDYRTGQILQQRLQEQNRMYTQGAFKEQNNNFRKIAEKAVGSGNVTAASFLTQQLQAEYRNRVDRAVAGGTSFNEAANTVAAQLEQEVEAGIRNPESKWYIKRTSPSAVPTFPKLNSGSVSRVEAADRSYQQLRSSIATQGLQKVLDTPESILTRAEAEAVVRDYGKPGFVLPRDVLAVSGMGNGTDPFTIINRQLTALGMPRLEPPQITTDVNNALTQQQRQEIYDAVNGPLQRMRTLETVSYNSGDSAVTGNRFANTDTMVGGSSVRNATTATNNMVSSTWQPGDPWSEPPITVRDPASGYQGGTNVVDTGTKDKHGRPIKFNPAAAYAWQQMIKDGMPFNPSHVSSTYRDLPTYLAVKAQNPGAAAYGHHNFGTGIDVHYATGDWIKANGAKYGWHLNDYEGGHGGHFEFLGPGPALKRTATMARPANREAPRNQGYQNVDPFQPIPASQPSPASRPPSPTSVSAEQWFKTSAKGVYNLAKSLDAERRESVLNLLLSTANTVSNLKSAQAKQTFIGAASPYIDNVLAGKLWDALKKYYK